MSHNRILVDVDGVLADYIAGVCKHLQAAGHTYITPDTFNSWDLNSALTQEQISVMDRGTHSAGFCRALKWYRGAARFLVQLKRLGTVHALTAPLHTSPHWLDERVEWLAPFIPAEDIIFSRTQDKHLHTGSLLIEDRAETLNAWCASHTQGKGILLHRPWNAGVRLNAPNATRVHTYTAALNVARAHIHS